MLKVPFVGVIPNLIYGQIASAKTFTTRSHESVASVNHPATFDGLIVAVDLTESFLDQQRPDFLLRIDLDEEILGSGDCQQAFARGLCSRLAC